MTSGTPTIPLAKAIEDLRSELLTAMRKGLGQELQFRLQPIELELEVAVTWDGEATSGIKFWVVELGAKGTYENASTHRLKLVLEPVGRDGKTEVRISDPNAQRPGE
jgi:hypothetical protein